MEKKKIIHFFYLPTSSLYLSLIEISFLIVVKTRCLNPGNIEQPPANNKRAAKCLLESIGH